MATRVHRYVIHQFWITVSAAAVFIALIAIGENTDGWASLAYLFCALATAALWLTVSAIYMTWIIIREGAQKPSRPAIAVLTSTALVAGGLALWLGV
jgi:hypothetical protein